MGATDLEHDVRDAAGALGALVPHAVSFGQSVVDSIQKVCAAIEPELAKSETVLAVMGDGSGKRALLRAILGEAIEGPKARRDRTIRIRARGPYDYVARRTNDDSVMRFARSVPDRDPLYQRQIDQAEESVRVAKASREALVAHVDRAREEVRAIEGAIAAIELEAEVMGQTFADAWRAHKASEARVVALDRAEPAVPPIFRTTPAWWAIWVWVMRWMVQSKWREPLQLRAQNRAEASAARERENELGAVAKKTEAEREALKARRDAETARLERAHAALAGVEVALAEEHALKDAEARADALLRDRAKYAGERREEFFADLHDFDATARGDEVGDLDLELPLDHPNAPPPGIVLAIGPDAEQGADGYVVVRDGAGRDRWHGSLPRAAVLSLRDDLTKALSAVQRTRIIAAKLGLELRTCIAEIGSARARAEADHAQRLAALESQRIPHPDEFRARQVARSESAIETSAGDILTAAIEHLRAELAVVRKDWTTRIESARGRRELLACMDDINQRGKLRVLELLEAVSELVAREMQSHGETIERFALDEIQSSYRTQKRMRAESLAPVASEVTGEDLADGVQALVPIVGARESHFRKRVQIALGGLVLGGAAGSIVHFGVGTGVGLAVGAVSLFISPNASLRRDCLAGVNAYVDTVASRVEGVLRAKRDDIALGIRAALDEALDEALRRINDAITRLMTVEKNAIESERATLAKLASTRGTLEEHDARLRVALEPFTDR